MIDVVRGLAACAILFWHYQHFVALGMAEAGSRSGYPLYGIFGLLYEQGGAAVQLFWIISGFVFSAVYVGSGVSARTFLQHRFARLYPLHFVTLIVVCGLQFFCMVRFGRPLIYLDNTLPNFLLQLMMGSGWGMGGASSFNGPIWSVSAEVLIYALFWLALGSLFRWGLVLPITASLGFLLLAPYSPIAACGGYFFLGCAVYVAHRSLPIVGQYLVSAISALIFVALLQLGQQGLGTLVLFAGVTLAAATLEGGVMSKWAAKVPWIADNTYGVYLWHVPIQLALLLCLSIFGASQNVVYEPWFLALFIGVVMCLARASFLLIERPARSALRKWFRASDPR